MILDTREAKIFFEDLGSGAPVLCLHAFPVDGAMWRAQYPLAQEMRLLVPDMRGMGRSSLAEGPSLMDVLAADMVAVLDHLEIARAVVLGLSLGGYVALALYRRFPERVRGLILADTRAEADTPEARERRLQTADALRREGVAAVLGTLPHLFGDTTKRLHPALIEEELHHAAAARPEGMALLQLGMAQRADATDLLPRIAVPTLVLCGEEDAVTPPAGMRDLAERIPGADFRLIPRAGHLAPLENPGDFNREVMAFMGRVG